MTSADGTRVCCEKKNINKNKQQLAQEPIFTSVLQLNNTDKPVGRGNLAISLNEREQLSLLEDGPHSEHVININSGAD